MWGFLFSCAIFVSGAFQMKIWERAVRWEWPGSSEVSTALIAWGWLPAGLFVVLLAPRAGLHQVPATFAVIAIGILGVVARPRFACEAASSRTPDTR